MAKKKKFKDGGKPKPKVGYLEDKANRLLSGVAGVVETATSPFANSKSNIDNEPSTLSVVNRLAGKMKKERAEATNPEEEGGWEHPISYIAQEAPATLATLPLAEVAGTFIGKTLGKAVKGVYNNYVLPLKYKKELAKVSKIASEKNALLETPEGRRRLEELGYNPFKKADHPTVTTDFNLDTHYTPFTKNININPSQLKKLNISEQAAYEHELGHHIQNIVRPVSKELKAGNYNPMKEYANRYASRSKIDQALDELPLDKGVSKAYKEHSAYFKLGTMGEEKLPFLREMRQNMLDNNVISHPYEKITPKHLNTFFKLNTKDRLANIVDKMDIKSYNLLKETLNKAPVLGGAAATAGALQDKEQFKTGGMIKRKKKKKLALGAYLTENQEALSSGTMLAGQIVQASGQPTNKTVSAGGLALTRAGQGAKAGAAFGPWGAAVGAVGGAIEGGIEGSIAADKARKRQVEQNAATEAIVTKQLVNNSKSAVAKGGKLASKLGVIQGGELNQISPDAVEVKANNPHQTDSVELQDAYVDHDEVIDNQNRVFSDELGFAKYAKKLEKQKSKSSRFTDANTHIDRKLDDLFQIQEQTKEGMKQGAKTHKAKGGYLRLTGPFPMKPTTKAGFETGGGLDLSKYNTTPFKFQNTTFTQPSLNLPEGKPFKSGYGNYTPPQLNLANPSSLEKTAIPGKPGKSFSPDLNKGVTALSTFGPNVVSALAQNRLQGPAVPQMERNVSLQRVNPNAQLAEADMDANQANQTIKNNTAQGADIASATGNILAKKFGNKNAIYGQNQQTNAGIQAQEAFMNTQIGARNVERTNQFTQGQNDFNNLQQKLTTENTANLSGKLLQQGREKNQMQLDKDKLRIDSYKYESGANLRWQDKMKQEDPEAYKRAFGDGLAYGGKLGTREICDEGMLDRPINIFGLYQKTEPHNAFRFENNEAQNLQAHKEKSKHGKSSHKLAKGGYVGGGETPNDAKTTPQKLSSDDFKRISWKSQGVQDSTGRGSMYSTTYGALNKLNNAAIPTGASPADQTYVINPTGLNNLASSGKPSYDISGSTAAQQGQLARFNTGGRLGLEETLGDPRHIEQASKAGLSKGGIHIKKSHRGLLHKDLGVPQGKKIPKSKLVVHSGDSAKLKKRKIFAQNFGHKH